MANQGHDFVPFVAPGKRGVRPDKDSRQQRDC